jgi:DNA glycosylase AlkZ-like
VKRSKAVQQPDTSLGWEQVISWRLDKGHLSRRLAARKLLDVIRDMCGAHAQILSSVSLALGARLEGLTRAGVKMALDEKRTLVKTWAMRGTLHVFSSEDLPLYCAAQATRDQYMNPSYLRYAGLEAADVEAVLEAVPAALDGRALTRNDLATEILRITKRWHLEERLRSGWGEMLKPAAGRGLMCFGPQTGRSITFVRPDQWIGTWERFDVDDALIEVFRRFLSAYAPATRSEIARWWGVRPAEANRVLKLMRDELEEVEVGGHKRWVLKADLSALESSSRARGVRLLPSFDQLLVMCAPHSQALVGETFVARIYRARIAVWSLPCLLIDGRAAGTWRLERKRNYSTAWVEPFKRLTRTSLTGLQNEVEALSELLETPVRLELASV